MSGDYFFLFHAVQTDLILGARNSEIGNGPGGLLLSLELSARQVRDDQRDELCVNHGLHLLLVASSDVGEEPDGLLADLLFLVGEQCGEVGERAAVEHHLCLVVSACDNVADGAQRCCLHFDLLVGQQGDQLGHHPRVDHHLDLLVSTISQVAQGPNCVNQHLRHQKNSKLAKILFNLKIYAFIMQKLDVGGKERTIKKINAKPTGKLDFSYQIQRFTNLKHDLCVLTCIDKACN